MSARNAGLPALVVVGLMSASSANASSDAGQATPTIGRFVSPPERLGGIAGFRVSIQGVDGDAVSAGLSEDLLKALVTNALENRGIAVIRTGKETLGLGEAADLTLSVFVAHAKVPHGAIALQVHQRARLLTGALVVSGTWTYVQTLTPPEWEEKPTAGPGADGGSTQPRPVGVAFGERIELALENLCSAYLSSRRTWLERQSQLRGRYAAGDEYLAAEQYERAIAEFSGIDTDSAYIGPALLKLAECYERQANYLAAATVLAHLRAAYPHSAAKADKAMLGMVQKFSATQPTTEPLKGYPLTSPAPPIPPCAVTTSLRPGMTKKQVTALLGEASLSTMATCGGAPGVKRWACETLSYSCSRGEAGLWSAEALFNNSGILQSWSVLPAL